jgi:protein TonB
MAVERAVVVVPGAVPRYPDALRGAGVEGRVVARFVVDTAGRVEPGSVQIVSAAHPAFAEAVRRTLPALRFRAAEAGGRRVRQLVDMPFDFVLTR